MPILIVIHQIILKFSQKINFFKSHCLWNFLMIDLISFFDSKF